MYTYMSMYAHTLYIYTHTTRNMNIDEVIKNRRQRHVCVYIYSAYVPRYRSKLEFLLLSVLAPGTG